jgi:hypothetical protein
MGGETFEDNFLFCPNSDAGCFISKALASSLGPEWTSSQPESPEGWMVSDQESIFLFGSSSIANHGGYLSCFLKLIYLVTTRKQ